MIESSVKTFEAGAAICRQGEPAESLFILKRGRVVVAVSTGADACAVDVQAPGHIVAEIADTGAIIGEAGLFLEHRTATLMAKDDAVEVEEVRFGNGAFQKLLEARPDTGLKLCRSLALRLRNLSEKMRAASEATYAVHLLYDSLTLSLQALVAKVKKACRQAPELNSVVEAALCLAPYRDARRLRERINKDKEIFAKSLAARRMKTIDLAPGAQLFARGEAGRVAYVIETGAVDLFVGDLLVSTLGPGELVGVVALLLEDELEEATRVQVKDGARVAPIAAEEFEQMVREIPSFLYGVARSLCRRIESSNRMSCDMACGVEHELDLLAGSPESCAVAFDGLARALELHPDLADLAKRARLQRDRALSGRDRLADTFRDLF